MFELVARGARIGVRTLTWIACTGLILVVLLLGYDVTLRYLGHSSIAGLHEGVGLACIFIYMLGIVEVYARDLDVDVDAVGPFLSPRGRAVKKVLVNALLAAVFALTAWYASQMIDASWRERTPVLRLPGILYQLALLLAVVFVAFVSLLQVWRHGIVIVSGKDPGFMPAEQEKLDVE